MYNKKTVKWKHRIDISVYKHPVFDKGDQSKQAVQNEETCIHRKKYDEMSDMEKERSDKRRKIYFEKKIYYLQDVCIHNKLDTFITFTFREDVTQYEDAKRYWALGLKRLKYRIERSIKYVAVHELQKKRGDVFHFHMLTDIGFFPYEELRDVWGYGGVYIEQIDAGTEAGRKQIQYIFKYIVKDVLDEIEIKERSGVRKIYCSRNLIKPDVSLQLSDESVDDVIFANMESVVETVSYDMKNYNGIKINEVDLVRIKNS